MELEIMVLRRGQRAGCRAKSMEDTGPGSCQRGGRPPRRYLIQELSRLLGQRVVGKHAVVTIDTVPSRVV